MNEEIKRLIEKIIAEKNNSEIPEFEGYSPGDMEIILYEGLTDKSPIKIKKISEKDYESIPILMQIKYIGEIIMNEGELKLTKKGFLPVKLVSDIYNKGYLKEKYIENGIIKLYKQEDSMTITLSRILLEISGIVKKVNNKLSITKKGKELLRDNDKLIKAILNSFCNKFNWGYFDGYENDEIGKILYGFSFILISKYGDIKRGQSFYSDKYFSAFPFLKIIEPNEKTRQRCYSLRTFERFMEYFGLIEIEQEDILEERYVKKTKLFDKLIVVGS